jgi:hypothetical protein
MGEPFHLSATAISMLCPPLYTFELLPVITARRLSHADWWNSGNSRCGRRHCTRSISRWQVSHTQGPLYDIQAKEKRTGVQANWYVRREYWQYFWKICPLEFDTSLTPALDSQSRTTDSLCGILSPIQPPCTLLQQPFGRASAPTHLSKRMIKRLDMHNGCLHRASGLESSSRCI